MTPGVPRAARIRAYVVGIVVTLGLVGVARRAWSLQISDGDHYRQLAEHQQELHLALPAPRGEVVDAAGRPLAVSADVDSIWANPKDVRDVATTAETLAKILGTDQQALEAKLAADHKFVWLARHVSPEIARAIAAAKLPGIETAKEPRRWYPSRAIAGPVIGRADLDGRGVDGIELAMNELLAGKRSDVAALRDARGHMMLSDGVGHATPGATVHLTLDRSIQAIAEAALADQIAAKKAKSGVVVVLDVQTSRVLAMASSPTYDPNSEETHGARNLAVTDAFEAGSVMKVFTIASALDAGAVTPATGFEIGNAYTVNPRVKAIRDVEFFPYLTTSEIIKYSSNIGAAKIGMRLGADKLYAGLKQFGFGKRTGVELPGERDGRVRAAANWRDVDLAHIAFGYGITVTPLQVAAGFAAIANHGVYREPRIVDSVTDEAGTALYKGEGVA
ncbi:MAG TPA: penicillin-binding protein 2, partial [Kofleriaceae bacterium]